MANATYSVGVPVNYGSCSLTLDIYETADSSKNESTIRGVLTLSHSGSGSPFNNNASSASMTIGSSNWSWSGGYNLPGNSSLTLLDKSVVVAHSADKGTGSVGVSGSFTGNGGFPIGSGTISTKTYTMEDFDRKPSTAGTVTASVNSNKSITVNVGNTTSLAGSPTFWFASSSDNGATWSAATTGTTSLVSGSTYTGQMVYTGFTPGQTYLFRAYATNSDGIGGTTTMASGVFLNSGGKRWNGSSWVPVSIFKRWNGTAWVDVTIAKRWNGSAWVDLT